jgi:hypothetical protein
MKVNRLSIPNSYIWVLIVIGLLAGTLHSESDMCLARTTLIDVSATNGESSEGLTAADFKVTVGGKAVSVQSATPPDRPPRVVLLVDASANHDQSSWAATQVLLDQFLAGFPGTGDFTLLTFDDRVQQVVHESDRAALQGKLAETFPSGKRESGVGLTEAVKKGSASFDAYRQGDAEFLITTSDQIGNETEQVLSQQRAAGTRLFGVSFGQSRRPDPIPFSLGVTVENYTPLEAAAKASGGRWTWFDASGQDPTASLQRATAIGKRAAMLVRDYFTLNLQLTKPLNKPEKLKIELIKSSRIDAKDGSILYPQELFPCQ